MVDFSSLEELSGFRRRYPNNSTHELKWCLGWKNNASQTLGLSHWEAGDNIEGLWTYNLKKIIKVLLKNISCALVYYWNGLRRLFYNNITISFYLRWIILRELWKSKFLICIYKLINLVKTKRSMHPNNRPLDFKKYFSSVGIMKEFRKYFMHHYSK